MTRDGRLTGDDVPRAHIAVDEFYLNHVGEVDVFQYGVLFTWCDPATLREYIANVIDDASLIGYPFDEIHGTVFVSSIISYAVGDECGVHFTPAPIIEDETIVIVGHSEGGVHLAIGEGEAWDPTMWQLRFGPRGAA